MDYSQTTKTVKMVQNPRLSVQYKHFS